MRNPIIALAAGALVLGAWAGQASALAIPSYVKAAVNDPSRSEMMRARDADRKPTEVLAFSGIKPGDKVGDLIPGGGYFTGLFSLVVGPQGHIYSIWPTEYMKVDLEETKGLVSGMTDPRFSNVTILIEPAAKFAAPESLDLVWTSQNYHDYNDPFMGPTDPRILDKAVYSALKPGGVYMVIDHVAEPGSGLRDTNTLHRIDPEVVKSQVTAAGFIFEGESRVLYNPKDPHTIKVFDPAIRGHTDQFVFKFRKPG
ncbi:MAG TPA: methyltransferase [Caulobacteraceae bacterium]|nr:methyltransferase [Caulobacteraceae bacterium]